MSVEELTELRLGIFFNLLELSFVHGSLETVEEIDAETEHAVAQCPAESTHEPHEGEGNG